MYEYWVTEPKVGNESSTDQMRWLNEVCAEGWELVCVNEDGRFYLRKLREV